MLADTLNIQNLTTLVFDIQDVGCRFYTYIWTLWDVMSVLPQTNIKQLVILDRPNPIRADIVQGPVLESPFSSFIGRYAIPLRHGMTVGELSNLFYGVLEIQQPYSIHVVTMKDYFRAMLYSDTKLPWVAPSPNMPTLNTALVYPGMGILEGTNLSEGRGTTTPFNVFGAGFFNFRFVDALRNATSCGQQMHTTITRNCLYGGGAVRETYFIPTFSKFVGNLTSGAELYVLDTGVFQPIAWGLTVVQVALQISEDTAINTASFDLHLGNNSTRLQLLNGDSIDDIVASWQPDLELFMTEREKYLLYK